ncbi:uncharacterized protein [Euwallacea fornicatus]|uniref:uncharacterized protein n=1 Tax=Euwallacea fornicatus TaxID=995702 RepID=UPI00338FA502
MNVPVAYQGGLAFLNSYSGLVKILEAGLNVTLIVFTAFLGQTFKPQFLCGCSIYGFLSVVVLVAFHLRGVVEKSDFPWFWVEFVNSSVLAMLLLIASSLLVATLTKGCIITGIIGFIAVMVYILDAIEKFNLAKSPRTRYVWSMPNMEQA